MRAAEAAKAAASSAFGRAFILQLAKILVLIGLLTLALYLLTKD